MKKLLFILPILSLLSLTSCNHEIKEVTPLKSKEVETFVDIDNEELKSLVTTDKDFILYVYQNGCMGCQQADEYIKQFVSETNIIIYGIHYYQYSKLQNGSDEYPYLKVTPTFFFYDNGEIINKVERIFPAHQNGYEKFKVQMGKSVNLNSNLYSLNKFDFFSQTIENNNISYNIINNKSTANLDEAIKNNSELNVIMSWSRCSDCQSLYSSYLYTSRIKNIKSPIYIFDVDFFRDKKPPYEELDKENYKVWLDFATKYGFSSYYDGKVPSLVRYTKGEAKEFVVYSNEGDFKNENDMYYFPNAQLEKVRNLREPSKEKLIEKARELELKEYDRLLNI